MNGTPELLVNSLRVVLLRDLRSLDDQIAAYPDDESVWTTAPGISNSAGNLTLHLVGNLRHFFGATLGGSAYVRDRAAEFSASGLSRGELRKLVQETISEVDASLEKIGADTLESAYPLQIGESSLFTSPCILLTTSASSTIIGDCSRRSQNPSKTFRSACFLKRADQADIGGRFDFHGRACSS
jgi:hypothetical protein